MKDESKANQFDEAANKAADSIVKFIMLDIQDNPKRFENVEATYAVRDVTRIEIEKYYADLRSTYDALVELAKYVNMRQEMETKPQDKNATYFDKLFTVKCALLSILSDPLVRAAIERSKK